MDLDNRQIAFRLNSIVTYRGVGRERVERDWEVGGQDNMHGEKLKMGFFNCRGWHSREVVSCSL